MIVTKPRESLKSSPSPFQSKNEQKIDQRVYISYKGVHRPLAPTTAAEMNKRKPSKNAMHDDSVLFLASTVCPVSLKQRFRS
jgi:hypothetical protein